MVTGLVCVGLWKNKHDKVVFEKLIKDNDSEITVNDYSNSDMFLGAEITILAFEFNQLSQ